MPRIIQLSTGIDAMASLVLFLKWPFYSTAVDVVFEGNQRTRNAHRKDTTHNLRKE